MEQKDIDEEEELVEILNSINFDAVTIFVSTPYQVREFQYGKVSTGLLISKDELSKIDGTNEEKLNKLHKLCEMINKKKIEGKQIGDVLEIKGKKVTF